MVENSNIRPFALQSPNGRFPMRPVLLDDVETLRADCWSHRTLTRSRDLIRRVQEAHNQARGLGVVVLHDTEPQRIIGYGQIMHWTQCAEISDLIVSAPFRSQGIGTALIQHLIHSIPLTNLDCIEIGVAHSNHRALNLYRRLGFSDSYTISLQVGGDDKEFVIYLRIPLR